jgi:hypothetical protein
MKVLDFASNFPLEKAFLLQMRPKKVKIPHLIPTAGFFQPADRSSIPQIGASATHHFQADFHLGLTRFRLLRRYGMNKL